MIMNFSSIVYPVVICIIPVLASLVCMILIIEEFRLRHGLLALTAGLFSVVPIAAIQFFINGLWLSSPHSLSGVLFRSLLINGVVEEAIKMAVLFVLPSKKMTLRSFFFCSVLSGLSLGCFETLVYIVSGIQNFELRLVTAVVIHACCAGLSGLFVYSVKNGGVKIFSFVLAVVLHGIYNYFAGFKMESFFFWFSIVVVIIAVVECRIRYRSMNPEGLILFQ